MKCLIIIAVLVVGTSYALPEPPVQQQGWAQAAPPVQQAPVAQGWGQQQAAPQQQSGWGQQQAAPAAQGWGQAQQGAPQQQGWGQAQPQVSSGWGQEGGSGGGKGGQKGIDWDWNFALGYQGEKGGQGKNAGGWGAAPAAQSGWGQSSSGGGGWSSEPETNIKKPSIGDIFGAIASFPRELKNLLKDSGLWILFLPLLIIIPLFIFAFSAGKFFGGMDEGWGWDKRSSSTKTWLETEWDNLRGFIKDPKVQRAAKGFMDEFVAKRIVTSVTEEDAVAAKNVEQATPAKKVNKKVNSNKRR